MPQTILLQEQPERGKQSDNKGSSSDTGSFKAQLCRFRTSMVHSTLSEQQLCMEQQDQGTQADLTSLALHMPQILARRDYFVVVVWYFFFQIRQGNFTFT